MVTKQLNIFIFRCAFDYPVVNRRKTVICLCNVDWLSSYNDDWLSEYGRSPWHYSKVKYGR